MEALEAGYSDVLQRASTAKVAAVDGTRRNYRGTADQLREEFEKVENLLQERVSVEYDDLWQHSKRLDVRKLHLRFVHALGSSTCYHQIMALIMYIICEKKLKKMKKNK